jgi:hypothetical protein
VGGQPKTPIVLSIVYGPPSLRSIYRTFGFVLCHMSGGRCHVGTYGENNQDKPLMHLKISRSTICPQLQRRDSRVSEDRRGFPVIGGRGTVRRIIWRFGTTLGD